MYFLSSHSEKQGVYGSLTAVGQGFTITSALQALRIPSLIAVPASIDERLPLSESIATTTFKAHFSFCTVLFWLIL